MLIDWSFLFTLLIANVITMVVSLLLIGRVLSMIVKRFMRQIAQQKIGTLAKQISNWLGIPEEWAQALITTLMQYYMAPQQKQQQEKKEEKPKVIWQ